MTAKFNADILGRLSEATPEELNAALSAIREDVQTYAAQPASQANVDALGELKNAATAIRGELSDRAALGDTQAAHLADINAALGDADEQDGQQEDSDGEQEAPADGGDQGSGDAPEGTEPASDSTGTTAVEPAVTAATRPRPAARQFGTVSTGVPNRAARRAAQQIKMRTTASAGVPGFTAGQAMDRESVWRAFAAKHEAVAGVPGFERYPVITRRFEFPEARILRTSGTALANMERVEAVLDDARRLHARDNLNTPVQVASFADPKVQSLTAAGLCAPLETLYDMRVIGDTDRPIRDSLPRFAAERGGIQYRPAVEGVSGPAGDGVWTTTNDEASPLVPKTCTEIVCPGVVTAEIEAVYKCLQFSNMSTRFDPEAYDAAIRAQDIAHARFAENRLYSQLLAGSKAVYSTQVLGAARDILATMDHMIAYYRNVHRLNAMVPLRWIAPLWVLYLIRADITRQMVGDGLQALAVTDQMIMQWLAERNLNVTWHLDGIDPADLTTPTPDVIVPAQFYTNLVTQSAVPGFPDAISSLLFAEGDWLYLDGGTMDLGVVRDSTLNTLNRFQTFSEEFAFPAFRGIESLHLVIQAQPTGQAAATKDTSGITD